MAELRLIKDFPKKGITFIDITPKLADKNDFNEIIDKMCMNVPKNVDYIVGPESRGYIFASAIANKLGLGFIPIRKEGKLPDDLVYKAKYEKEYGIDILCLPKNDGYLNKNFYVVDDVLATGGTLKACKELIEKCGGNYIGTGVYINIKKLNNEQVDYVLEFDE
ncbi:MAG: adenine phosphoribosyltransferase [Bacilli bacterium]|nr:adenine phosphoribosyltransferase [Bacilli bacterium]